MTKSPYETLGVSAKASQDDIRNSYRNLAKKFHPDLNPGNKEAENKFKVINGAYEQIGTPEQRAKFDRSETEEAQGGSSQPESGRRGPFYHQTQQGGGRYTHSFEGMDDDLLNSIFGQRGQDELYRMDVEFKDAVMGAEREIGLPNGKKLRVKIPAGVESGAKLRFAGQGNSGGKAPAGDVYVQLNVASSPLFKRLGDDLEMELPISVSEAILGGEIKVPTIDGSILLKVPSGVSSGQRLRVPGKGVPGHKGTKRGDQFVILKIMTPPTVDPAFKEAVAEWSKRQSFDPRASLGK